MADTYLTLQAASQGWYREKMSKFLAFAIPVTSAEQARQHIAEYQKKYYDARHVCWAYMIGASRTEFQSNDNGEPSGTAGRPILGQINSFQLTNIVIIVVRYFGGIKLGTSGLIAAYKEAAREAIIAANIIELHEQTQIEVTFLYISMNSVMKTIKDSGADIMEQIFDNSCYMKLSIRSDHADSLQKKLSDIDGTTIHNP
ncbi:YigZ family protein [uncultured Muribaculum sp.]|uniref:IMPACT family protein n=1 Tax=uncultured Muribaculum sp. TaxID=1918613 RepID=UPI0026704D22|nr:YigZ family protein [uncultured Muribaculum sp.]